MGDQESNANGNILPFTLDDKKLRAKNLLQQHWKLAAKAISGIVIVSMMIALFLKHNVEKQDLPRTNALELEKLRQVVAKSNLSKF